MSITKAELTEQIAQGAGISKADAGRALEATIDTIRKTLKDGGSVPIAGFGTFSLTKRQARSGRNPRTGDVIQIKASTSVKFTPGKKLKDQLN